MSNRFVVTSLSSYKDTLFAGFFDDHKLLEVNSVSKDPPLNGRIYAAKVTNVSPNLDACFVSAGDDGIFFLPFENLTNAVFIKKSSDQKIICAGDELLVQVKTEPVKSKNAVCTGELSLAGTFCVLTSNPGQISVSKKIGDNDRERLIKLAESVCDAKTGVIIRTNALNASDETISKELVSLQKKLLNLFEYGTKSMPFSCLYDPWPSFISLYSDIAGKTDSIVTDDREVYDIFMRYADEIDPSVREKTVFYEDDYPLDKLYSFEHQINKALKNTVHLPGGGNIVITVTEALTVIDVNTGSNIKSADKKDIIVSTNLEAAKEIAFQLRLRNISGIVIVDFIDMEKEGEEKILSALNTYTRDDVSKVNILDFTRLGLLELTRKKIRRPLFEQIRSL